MSNDVERLREALRLKALENVRSGERAYPVLSVNDVMDVLGQEGVTLPTPPRVTPLEAAARVIGHEFALLDDEAINCARKTLTAAVGALSEEAVREVWEAYTKPSTAQDGRTAFRAALLARLTEGGN